MGLKGILRYKNFTMNIVVKPRVVNIEENELDQDLLSSPEPIMTLMSVDNLGTVILDTENLNS